MSIKDRVYRTQTYLAGGWTEDKDAIQQMQTWNNSSHWSLHYMDVHNLTQSRDESLSCSIKQSLKARMDVSKTFVLIVGEKTNSLTAGACRYCPYYNSGCVWQGPFCSKGRTVDNRSFIEYECAKAVEAGIKIVVLYKDRTVDKSKCPILLRDKGIHVAMKKYVPSPCGMGGYVDWDYQSVKNALK